MKTLILASAFPLFVSFAAAQDTPPPAPDKKDAPAETVRKATAPAWLGVSLSENDGRVELDHVLPDSPAAKAGLKDGDIVVRIGDQAVAGDPSRIISVVRERKPGEAIELSVRRGDKEETIKVQLAERPSSGEEFRGEFRRKMEDDLEKRVHDEVKKAEEQAAAKLKERMDKQGEKQWEEKSGRALNEAAKAARELEEELEDLRGKERQQWKKNGGLHLKRMLPEEKRLDYFGPAGPPRLLEKMPNPARELQLYMSGKPDKAAEDAIWKRVEKSVGRALKESGLPPEVIEKAMGAVKEARQNGPEQEARRAKLKAEANRIEKEMQALKERADKLRDELHRSEE